MSSSLLLVGLTTEPQRVITADDGARCGERTSRVRVIARIIAQSGLVSGPAMVESGSAPSERGKMSGFPQFGTHGHEIRGIEMCIGVPVDG